MTEKRFTLSEVGCYRTSLIVDDGRKMGNTEVVKCLNALHEENHKLKKENKLLKDTLSSIVFDGKNVEIMTNGDFE